MENRNATTENTNTYYKYCPNVFVAKCPQMHARGEVITMETRRKAFGR